MAFSSSNSTSASALHSSVLPTPVGPRKMNEPIGRFGSCKPERLRRTALDTASTASSWPTTRWCRRSSSTSSLARSVSSMRRDRNAGPGADDFGDFLGPDFLPQQPAAAWRLGGRRCRLGLELLRAASCARRRARTAAGNRASRIGMAGGLPLLDRGAELVEFELDLVELAARSLRRRPGPASRPPTARAGWPACGAAPSSPLRSRRSRSCGVLFGLFGQLPGGQLQLRQPALHLVDLGRHAFAAPSPAGWSPRPSGRSPCRAESGR